ncbi:hypothetical protein V6N12_036243 [Hibiscus sabdariffa]|uniref:Uncharacterized protein n=1 Tax=Hibiscus sabdariffa TaxID=183260 RepID=A0ABR2EQ11_9ROSI
MARPWELRFSFVWCESNGVTDVMTCLVHPRSLDYRRWLEPPLTVRNVSLVDEEYVVPMDNTDASYVQYPLPRAYDDSGDS